MPVDEKDLAPAWDRFTTAPFTIAGLLSVSGFKPGPAATSLRSPASSAAGRSRIIAGTRTIDVGEPGFGRGPACSDRLSWKARCVPRTELAPHWPAGAQAPYEAQLRKAFAPAAAADPVVAPPVYGRTQTNDPLPRRGSHRCGWASSTSIRASASPAAGGQVVQNTTERPGRVRLGPARRDPQSQSTACGRRSWRARSRRRSTGGISRPSRATATIWRSPVLRIGASASPWPASTSTLSSQIGASRLPSGAVSSNASARSRVHAVRSDGQLTAQGAPANRRAAKSPGWRYDHGAIIISPGCRRRSKVAAGHGDARLGFAFDPVRRK